MKTSTLVEPSALFQTAVAGMCRVSALCISLVKRTWFMQRTKMQRHSVWIHWASGTVHFHQDDNTSVILHTRCCSPDVRMDFILTQVRRSRSLYGDIAGASASTSAASGVYSSTSHTRAAWTEGPSSQYRSRSAK